MSLDRLKNWCRRRYRWRRLIGLIAVVVLLHSFVAVQAQTSVDVLPEVINSASATYSVQGTGHEISSNLVTVGTSPPLIDPAGNLFGCDGQPLSSYEGFSMSLYEPDASGLELGSLVSLTPTAGTDSIPPNSTNSNPFEFLSNLGRYNFLLDSTASLTSPVNVGLTQTSAGAEYILVISPSASSGFEQRRVLITLIDPLIGSNGDIVALRYQARSLDGQPLSVDGSTELTKTVVVNDAANASLTFFEFGFDSVVCEAAQVRLTKTADRSAAQPGDTIVYRLSVHNTSSVPIDRVTAYDNLPTGFRLISDSSIGELDGVSVPVTANASGNHIRFDTSAEVQPDQVLNILYAVRLTPDALRGDGRNSATITAERTDSRFRVQDGPSSHRITLDPGILSDCGTLIGRVFEDKNFDGEQQPGEAGIPNAVIFLDDGNRVVTDADGLFSVQKMLPGQRSGTLELASLPGYTLAPNLYFNERNSYSRLVNLAPGGLARMNFGVTPTFQEVED